MYNAARDVLERLDRARLDKFPALCHRLARDQSFVARRVKAHGITWAGP